MFSIVDFPLPDGPCIAMKSPFFIERLTPCSALTLTSCGVGFPDVF